jgi:ketosteroid isomerase-like protein
LRHAPDLIAMTNPDVVIRPFLARQTPDAVSYVGHEGIRKWIDSLDADTTITLELKSIEITSERSAVVEADVFYERGGTQTGGPTFSVWRFDNGKLSESVGYGTKEDALDAETYDWG